MIRCSANGGVYIGGSVNIESRLRVHKHHLKHGIHPNFYLQRAYNKHGSEKIIFSVVEPCERHELMEKEYEIMDSMAMEEGVILFNVILSDDECKRKAMAFLHWTNEGVAIRAKGVTSAWNDEEKRKIWVESLRKNARTDDNRKRVSEQAKKQWANPEFKKKVVEKLKQNAATDPAFKRQVSKASKNNWQRQEYRDHLSSERKKMWANAEFKSQRIKAINKLHKDPNFMKKRAEGMKAFWASPEGLARKAKMAEAAKGNSGVFTSKAISSQAQ